MEMSSMPPEPSRSQICWRGRHRTSRPMAGPRKKAAAHRKRSRPRNSSRRELCGDYARTATDIQTSKAKFCSEQGDSGSDGHRATEIEISVDEKPGQENQAQLQDCPAGP
jgi:hypothetical protein